MISIRLVYFPARESPNGERYSVGSQFFGGATGRWSVPLILGPSGHSEELTVSEDFGSDCQELPPAFLFDPVVDVDGSKGPATWLVVSVEAGQPGTKSWCALCLTPPDDGDALARAAGSLN